MILFNRVEIHIDENNVYSENEYYEKLLEFCLNCGINNLLCPELYKNILLFLVKLIIRMMHFIFIIFKMKKFIEI
jgi:hypothetical protein